MWDRTQDSDDADSLPVATGGTNGAAPALRPLGPTQASPKGNALIPSDREPSSTPL